MPAMAGARLPRSCLHASWTAAQADSDPVLDQVGPAEPCSRQFQVQQQAREISFPVPADVWMFACVENTIVHPWCFQES